MISEALPLLSEAEGLSGDFATRSLALRKRGHSLENVALALALLEGRERAKKRGFPHAERLFVTPDALAQATSPLLAQFHAAQLAPYGKVADVACGLGFDTMAFAEAGLKVLAIERDPARLALARANAEALGLTHRITFLEADATEVDLADWPAIYFDPARRADATRFSAHAERYEPPLTLMQTWAASGKVVLAKLSPALPDDVLHSLGESVRFLSESRECKEACVSSGLGSQTGALLLPEELFVPTGADEDIPIAETIGEFLLDPDPALIRAGALTGVGAERISYEDAYLTTDTLPDNSRLARAYRIIETMPYQPKKLGAWLKGRNIGRLVVKKRRFPKEPDAVQKELGLKGTTGEEITLVLVAAGRGHLAVICTPV
ncbi:MAG: class I SAM-dependent methyltransferase [Armatimonas sp.]